MRFTIPKRHAGWIVGLVLLLVYAACISPHWKLGRDSSLYLGLARSLVEGQGFTLAGLAQEGVPPGLPVMLAVLWLVAGPNYLLMNAAMAVLALVTLWFVYRSVSEIAGAQWGLLVAALTGLSYRMIQTAGQIMSDMPAMCCLWIGFYYLQRSVLRSEASARHALAAGAAMAAGCAFRLSTPFFFPAVVLAPWLAPTNPGHGVRRRLRHSALLLLPAILAVAVAKGFTRQNADVVARYSAFNSLEQLVALTTLFGNRLLAFLDATLETVTTQDANAKRWLETGDFDPGRVAFTAVLLIAMAAVLVAGAWRLRRKDRGLGFLMVGCYVLGVCLIAPMPTPRYVLPVLPWVIWFLAEALEAAWQRLKRRADSAPAQGILPVSLPVAALLALLLVPNLSKASREVRLAHTRDYYAVYQRGRWQPYVEVGEWIRAHTPPGARLASRENSVLAYLSDRYPLLYPQWLARGDLLILETSVLEGSPKTDPMDVLYYEGQKYPGVNTVGRHLVKSGLVEEIHRSGPLIVYRVRPPPAARR